MDEKISQFDWPSGDTSCHGKQISVQGPVVQKPIKANPRLKINREVYFSTSKMLFTTDIRQNFTLEEVNLEKQK